MVPASLDVQGSEVKSHGVGDLEEPLGEVLRQTLVGELGREREETSEDRVQTSLLNQPPGAEERFVKRKITLIILTPQNDANLTLGKTSGIDVKLSLSLLSRGLIRVWPNLMAAVANTLATPG